eukprot:SAG31_NODE_687_length_12813_cov_2.597216_10_plen_381_part_00
MAALPKVLAVLAAGIPGAAALDPRLLRDHPIVGHSRLSLDTADGAAWTAHPTSGSPAAGSGREAISASVPGDIVTDLEVAGLIGDPWYETNWRNATLWDQPWTYSTLFTLTADEHAAVTSGAVDAILVFDGIKMGATVTLDGKVVGTATDQWLRYEWPVTQILRGVSAGTHHLHVSFDRTIDTHGRFMGCSGGWDWAPMSTTTTPDRSPTFSYGIWKSVALVFVKGTAIAHVAPRVFTASAFPTDDYSFDVTVAVHFNTPGLSTVKGQVDVHGDWGATATQTLELQPGRSVVELNVSATSKQVELWWPVGMGAQPLYNITIQVMFEAEETLSISTSRRIGFRDFKLVTGARGDDPDANGSGNYTVSLARSCGDLPCSSCL